MLGILDSFEEQVAHSLEQLLDNLSLGTILVVAKDEAEGELGDITHVEHYQGIGVSLE